MNGFLIANKPTGITSSNLVVFVRKRLPRGTSVGHGGTLDPEASGVLPVCVGSATRLFDYIIDKKKTYIAELQLGVVTDTQDATGQVVEEREVQVTEDDLRAVLPRFIGDIEQIPPAFSAIKRDGKRMYDLARKGQAVELEARPVTVDNVEYLTALENGGHMIKITCRKGVYIRTICHDIGQALGVGGHMAFLLRNRAGYFDAEHGVTPEELDEAFKSGGFEHLLTSLDAPLQHIPAIHVSSKYFHAIKNGNPLKPGWYEGNADGVVRVYMDGKFAGMGEADENGLIRFRAMLMEMNECE
jgi:tRNA pseudouridine55 synthase